MLDGDRTLPEGHGGPLGRGLDFNPGARVAGNKDRGQAEPGTHRHQCANPAAGVDRYPSLVQVGERSLVGVAVKEQAGRGITLAEQASRAGPPSRAILAGLLDRSDGDPP